MRAIRVQSALQHSCLDGAAMHIQCCRCAQAIDALQSRFA